LRELASFCAKIKEPYVIGGDFNIMRISSDKNKNFLPNRFSDIFNTIININGLRELYVSEGGGGCTWSNNQVNPTLEKLDRILMSREWENMFPAVFAYKRRREFSDHNPIIMDFQLSTMSQIRSFRFESSITI
jgi:exonuclease III